MPRHSQVIQPLDFIATNSGDELIYCNFVCCFFVGDGNWKYKRQEGAHAVRGEEEGKGEREEEGKGEREEEEEGEGGWRSKGRRGKGRRGKRREGREE